MLKELTYQISCEDLFSKAGPSQRRRCLTVCCPCFRSYVYLCFLLRSSARLPFPLAPSLFYLFASAFTRTFFHWADRSHIRSVARTPAHVPLRSVADQGVQAAWRIWMDPLCTRGGPWRLIKTQLAKIIVVAGCRSLLALMRVIKDPLGFSRRYLQN